MPSKAQQKSKQGKRNKAQVKERGFWLQLLLIIMAIHGIFATYFYYTVRTQEPYLERPMILTLMVIHSLANVIAAVGIWYWKKWALYVYAGSTILALVVGLLSVGAWSVFYMILPLIILGWVLRTKWGYFT
jgi:peptidoglycan biosynthesis protein MviN/MurJ (putative lipid II flippase)